jgi:acetyltransferase-like isoleucine patch superfamily enzyme
MLYTVGDLFDVGQTVHGLLFDGVEFPWEPLSRLPVHIATHLKPGQYHRTVGSAFISSDVFIGEGTVVEHGAMITGPAIIGRNCQIRHNAYIRENVVIGDDCVIGNGCEIRDSILLNGVQVSHQNYIGHSILGHRAHLGAGAIVSNYKLNGETVWIEMDGRCIDTGLRKLGALIGDFAEIGCNAVLNPGSILGRRALIYPTVSWRGVLPANMIAKDRSPQDVVIRRVRGPIG